MSSGNQIPPRRCLLCPLETRLHREDVRCILRKPDCTEKMFVVSSGNQIALRRLFVVSSGSQIAPRRCSLCPLEARLHREDVRCVLRKPDCTEKMFVVSSENRLHREDVHCILRKPDCTEKMFIVSSGNQIAPRRCLLCPQETRLHRVRCVLRNQIAPRRCSLCPQKPVCTEKMFVVAQEIAPLRCSLCVQALYHRGVFLYVAKKQEFFPL